MAWDFQQCGMCDQQSLRSVCAYAQSDQSLCWSLEYSMSVKLLTEHDLEFLSLKGDFTGSSESTLVKMPHCWKSHTTAQLNMIRVCHNYRSHTNLRHRDKVMSQYIFATKYCPDRFVLNTSKHWEKNYFWDVISIKLSLIH